MSLFLNQLINNTKKIFPKTYDQASIYSPDVKIEKYDFFEGTKTLMASGTVKKYFFSIRLFPIKNQKEVIKASKVKAQVKCSCPAFQYFVQNSIYTKTSLAGRPSKWAKVPANVRNPKDIAGLCKHLLAAFIHLESAGKLVA